jgi:hypothetical protein
MRSYDAADVGEPKMEDRLSVRRMGLRTDPIEADTTCVLERARNAAIRSNAADHWLRRASVIITVV